MTKTSIPAGSEYLVEYDPTSLWYASSVTIAVGWLKSGGARVNYLVSSQPPDKLRSQFRQLGLNVEELEREDKLRIEDWYSIQLGQKSKEKYSIPSLKIPDLSIAYGAEMKLSDWPPQTLKVMDDVSFHARFNDEKLWVQFALTRGIRMAYYRKSTELHAIMRGVHSQWATTQLEAVVDGVIDFKVEETEGESKTFMRLRNMKNLGYDAHWHRLKIDENSEVAIER